MNNKSEVSSDNLNDKLIIDDDLSDADILGDEFENLADALANLDSRPQSAYSIRGGMTELEAQKATAKATDKGFPLSPTIATNRALSPMRERLMEDTAARATSGYKFHLTDQSAVVDGKVVVPDIEKSQIKVQQSQSAAGSAANAALMLSQKGQTNPKQKLQPPLPTADSAAAGGSAKDSPNSNNSQISSPRNLQSSDEIEIPLRLSNTLKRDPPYVMRSWLPEPDPWAVKIQPGSTVSSIKSGFNKTQKSPIASPGNSPATGGQRRGSITICSTIASNLNSKSYQYDGDRMIEDSSQKRSKAVYKWEKLRGVKDFCNKAKELIPWLKSESDNDSDSESDSFLKPIVSEKWTSILSEGTWLKIGRKVEDATGENSQILDSLLHWCLSYIAILCQLSRSPLEEAPKACYFYGDSRLEPVNLNHGHTSESDDSFKEVFTPV